MKLKKSILLCGFMFTIFMLNWCTKTTHSESAEITPNEYPKLIYLLQWVTDIANDQADTWNKPLSTDAQKWTFVFNILNSNYMDKYEIPEEASENPYYPILDDSFIPNDWDVHDWVFPIDENVKVAYKKSDIDKILKDIVWDTLKDWSKIVQDWMILSGDKYLFFTYEYYWSDLIWNKWRWTRFEIYDTNKISEKIFEIKARYWDDALEDGWVFGDYWETECNLTFRISRNPDSFYWFTVNEYMYTWCKMDKNYIAPDYPSQLVYGISDGLYSDYVTLKRDFEIRDVKIDLNGDWVDEYFVIWPDNPNWTKILWVVWDKWYNFIYDFTNEIMDDYNDLLDWLFAEMYFEDLNWDGNKEVIVVIWNKKTWLEANVYKKLWWEEWFTKLWTIHWKSYLEYYEEDNTLHAPYSKNWVCQSYDL